MEPHRFGFTFTRAYRIAAAPFGIRPATAWVEVNDTELRARFGPWRLTTARENVVAAEPSGGYTFVKTAGPAHLSFADKGLTFATNPDHGVCLRFEEPVPVLDPTGRLRHPGLTVTVTDHAGLVDLLS